MLWLCRLRCEGQLQKPLWPLRHVIVQAAELHRLGAETAAAITLWLWSREAAGQLQGLLPPICFQTSC